LAYALQRVAVMIAPDSVDHSHTKEFSIGAKQIP
jgi:hypothetical protein